MREIFTAVRNGRAGLTDARWLGRLALFAGLVSLAITCAVAPSLGQDEKATTTEATNDNAVRCLRLQGVDQVNACRRLADSCKNAWCTDDKCKFECGLGKLFAEARPVGPVSELRPAFRIDLPTAFVPLLPRGDADRTSIGKQKALEALDKQLTYEALRDSGLAR